MHKLQIIENPYAPFKWRESSFCAPIPPVAMVALAAYHQMSHFNDLSTLEKHLAASPGLSGRYNALFKKDYSKIKLVRKGEKINFLVIRTLSLLIVNELVGVEDRVRRYELTSDQNFDVTLLPMLNKFDLCLAVIV